MWLPRVPHWESVTLRPHSRHSSVPFNCMLGQIACSIHQHMSHVIGRVLPLELGTVISSLHKLSIRARAVPVILLNQRASQVFNSSGAGASCPCQMMRLPLRRSKCLTTVLLLPGVSSSNPVGKRRGVKFWRVLAVSAPLKRCSQVRPSARRRRQALPHLLLEHCVQCLQTRIGLHSIASKDLFGLDFYAAGCHKPQGLGFQSKTYKETALHDTLAYDCCKSFA